jgi:hypothetical protein
MHKPESSFENKRTGDYPMATKYVTGPLSLVTESSSETKPQDSSYRRVVPLVTAAQRVAAPAHLSYGGGPLLTNVEVSVICWGAAWQQPAQSGLIPQLNQFFDFILTSSLIDLLGQYSVSGKTIGHGTRVASTVITTSEPGGGSGNVSDAQIQQALRGWITAGTVSQPNANSLYFVYLPPNVTATDPQGDVSCTQMCGYHWYIGGTAPEVYYAVMPYPGCGGCTGSLTVLNAMTSTSSHELCEAITDPQPWSGWNDNSNGEIGDICAWQTQTIGGFTVQKEWSNGSNVCSVLPPQPSGPYQTRIFESATTFGNENDGVWLMADYDRDGIPDLVFVKTNNTPSGRVEVHVASGASRYQTRIFESPTTFGNENDGTWLMADYDRDGIPDLVFVKTNNTPSGRVEVHIASGT